MEEFSNKIKYLIKKKRNFREICEDLDLKDYELIGLIELMKQDGELIDYLNGEVIKLTKPIINNDVYEIKKTESNRFLFISDTHLASKYDRIDILKHIYRKAKENEIDTVLHVGDLTDGFYPNRQNHVYELKVHSVDDQADYVINKYPQVEGIKTYAITGN